MRDEFSRLYAHIIVTHPCIYAHTEHVLSTYLHIWTVGEHWAPGFGHHLTPHIGPRMHMRINMD